jgi:AMMECR1 domain-containing protein
MKQMDVARLFKLLFKNTAVCGLMIGCVLMAAALPLRADSADLNDPVNQKAVLKLARRAFDAYARSRVEIAPPSPLPAVFAERHGVFVSTMRSGAPRTCMGTLYPCQSNFAEEIIENAAASAGRDRRFPAVGPGELSKLDLIVSVITSRPRPISEQVARSLDPARDGLAVLYGDRYGVVLSGETYDPANMVKWGRIRAGAPKGSSVRLFEIHDIRFMESEFN